MLQNNPLRGSSFVSKCFVTCLGTSIEMKNESEFVLLEMIHNDLIFTFVFWVESSSRISQLNSHDQRLLKLIPRK